MYNRKQFYHNMQLYYFRDVAAQIFPDQKVNISEFHTTQEDNRCWPLQMNANIKVGKKKYEAAFEYRNWQLKNCETRYGMFVLFLDPLSQDEEKRLFVINPVTAEVDINLSEEEQERFYRDLSVWPDSFDNSFGRTECNGYAEVPDLLDVVIARSLSKRKQEAATVSKPSQALIISERKDDPKEWDYWKMEWEID